MIIINLVGLVLIGAIIWWFWLYKPKAVIAGDEEVITITVDNGIYDPSRIQLPTGKPATLRFIRKDASPCAATVVFADFDISEELPINKSKDILLPSLQPGEYDFTCQMQMYRGKLIITGNKNE